MKKYAIIQKGQTRYVDANTIEGANAQIGNDDYAVIREAVKPTGPAAPVLRKMFNI